MTRVKSNLIIILSLLLVVAIPFYISKVHNLYILSVVGAFIESAIIFCLIAYTITKAKVTTQA